MAVVIRKRVLWHPCVILIYFFKGLSLHYEAKIHKNEQSPKRIWLKVAVELGP